MAISESAESLSPYVELVIDGIERSVSFLTLLRRIKGQSIEDLATLSGVSPDTIRGIEANEGLPNRQTLIDIAKGYRIDPRDIDEEYMYDDPSDKMKGGRIKDRDRRFGKSDEFWIWFHRAIKPLDPKRDWSIIDKHEIDELEEEWIRLKCPVPTQCVVPPAQTQSSAKQLDPDQE